MALIKVSNSGFSGTKGITEADKWKLNVSASGLSNGVELSSDIVRSNDPTFAKIGTGMSFNSGIFTFPQTGLYLVKFDFTHNTHTDNTANFFITASSDGGSSFQDVARGLEGHGNNGATYGSGTTSAFINVTNSSNFQVKFYLSSMGANFSLIGNANYDVTSFIFIRLGDSQ